MRRMTRRSARLIALVSVLAGTFLLGRFSAYGAVHRIPVTFDHILIGVGMVKATAQIAVKNEEKMVDIARKWDRRQYTRTQANQQLQSILDGQEAQIDRAVSLFLARNVQFKKGAGTPNTELSEEMVNLIEHFMTKFPGLFQRYGN